MADLDALVNTGLYPIGARPTAGDKTIVVVGVARGGTSVVAGGLAAMGIFMGEKAYPPVFEDLRLTKGDRGRGLVRGPQDDCRLRRSRACVGVQAPERSAAV